MMRDLRPGERNYMDADDAKRRIEPLRHKRSIHSYVAQPEKRSARFGCLGVVALVLVMIVGLVVV